MKTGEFYYLALVLSAYAGFAATLFACMAMNGRRERRMLSHARRERPDDRVAPDRGWKSQTGSLR